MITNDDQTNLQKLREALHWLTYAEMMFFAQWFADADKTEEQINDASFWAFIINEWAESAELAEDEQ